MEAFKGAGELAAVQLDGFDEAVTRVKCERKRRKTHLPGCTYGYTWCGKRGTMVTRIGNVTCKTCKRLFFSTLPL